MRRKAIDFMMFHYRIYAKSSLFYAKIIEKIKDIIA